MESERDTYARFQDNVRKAAALARSQEYLEDVLEGGCRKSANALRTILKDKETEALMPEDSMGLLRQLMDAFVDLRPIIESVMVLIKKREKSSEGYHGVLANLEILEDHALLEQAVVSAVTALEVYSSDTASDIIRVNGDVRRRLFKFVNASILKKRLMATDWDLENATSEIDSYDVKFTDPKSILKVFRLILEDDTLLADQALIRELTYVTNLRHIIVHNSCKADKKFIARTGYKRKMGQRVPLSLQAVGRWIHIIDSTGTKIEKALERSNLLLGKRYV